METYSGHVKTPQDAIVLFEACRLGLLPRVQRRLSEKERQLIKSGSVFVWDEREAGMRRWTDGKSWSASRVNGSFLTYREMEGKRSGGSNNYDKSPGKNSNDANDDNSGDGPDGYRYKPDGLTKQSFSITTSQGQHLHLISYFSRSHANSGSLVQPSSDPALRHVRPERGMYPESTLQDHSNTPALTRSPMTTIGGRHALDGSPYQPTTATTPQYAQPRHLYHQNRAFEQGQAQWPPSPMNTPPINGAGYSPHYTNGSPNAPGTGSGSLRYNSSLMHSAQSSYSSYPPNHHRDVGSTTAFDRLPSSASNGTALPPPPYIANSYPSSSSSSSLPPAPQQPTLPPAPQQPTLPPTSYPPTGYSGPTSNPASYTFSAPTSYPSSYPTSYPPSYPSSGPTPPESNNTLPPFRRNPSPLRDRSDSGISAPNSLKDVLLDHDTARDDRYLQRTPPLSNLPALSEKGRDSPQQHADKKDTIPSIGALISQTPPPDQQQRRSSPPQAPAQVQAQAQTQAGGQQAYPSAYQSPYQKTPPRPALGSRSGSFHGSEGASETAGRVRSSGDMDVLRKLDGAFKAGK